MASPGSARDPETATHDIIIDAVVDGGMIRPQTPLPLADGTALRRPCAAARRLSTTGHAWLASAVRGVLTRAVSQPLALLAAMPPMQPRRL